MRIGLIAVGAAFAIVGAGVIAAMTLPVPGPTVTQTGVASVSMLAPDTNRTLLLTDVATGAGSVSLVWASTAPVDVEWHATEVCPSVTGWCPLTDSLQNWTATPSGQWSAQGKVPSLYCLFVENVGSSPANFSAGLLESYPTTTHVLPLMPLLWTMAGGSLLVGVGAMAIYLGLFLPSGVYANYRGEGGDPPDDELFGPGDPPGGLA